MSLVDNNTLLYLKNALTKSYDYKIKWNIIIFNIFVCVLLLSVLALYISYLIKNKLPKEVLEEKIKRKYHETLMEVNKYRMEMLKQSQMGLNDTPPRGFYVANNALLDNANAII